MIKDNGQKLKESDKRFHIKKRAIIYLMMKLNQLSPFNFLYLFLLKKDFKKQFLNGQRLEKENLWKEYLL